MCVFKCAILGPASFICPGNFYKYSSRTVCSGGGRGGRHFEASNRDFLVYVPRSLWVHSVIQGLASEVEWRDTENSQPPLLRLTELCGRAPWEPPATGYCEHPRHHRAGVFTHTVAVRHCNPRRRSFGDADMSFLPFSLSLSSFSLFLCFPDSVSVFPYVSRRRFSSDLPVVHPFRPFPGEEMGLWALPTAENQTGGKLLISGCVPVLVVTGWWSSGITRRES